MSNLKRNLELIHQSVAKLQKKPIGLARQQITDKNDGKIMINGVEVTGFSPSGIVKHCYALRHSLKKQWDGHFSKGRWNRIKMTAKDVTMSDANYFCMSKAFAKKVCVFAYQISRSLLDMVWTEEITDCDDFMKLIAGLMAVILYKSSVRNAGAGVAMVKINYYDGGVLCGHALNAVPIWENGAIRWYLLESQNAHIYEISQDTEIHFLDM